MWRVCVIAADADERKNYGEGIGYGEHVSLQQMRVKGKTMVKELCVLGLLGTNAWLDIKKREISLAVTGIFAVIGILLAVREGSLEWQYLAAAGIGLLFLGISGLTGGKLGMGDGFMILAMGTLLSMEQLLTVLMLGMLSCACYAGLLLLVFRKNRNTRIPFVPFLLVGYIGGLLLC